MNCETCKELMIDYVEGLVDDSARRDIESHLKECPSCSAEMCGHARLHARLIANGQHLAGISLETSIMTRIQRAPLPKLRRIAMLRKHKKAVFGIAAVAATLAVAVLAWMSFDGAEASAAEVLRGFAAVNEAYKGWIHITFDSIPEAMQRQGVSRAKGLTLHINPDREISAKVIDWEGGGRTIDWVSRSDGIHKSYSSTTNEILISKDDEDKKKGRRTIVEQITEELKSKRERTPWQLAQILFGWPTMDGIMALVDYGCDVARGTEGGYDRFDLTIKREGTQDRGRTSPFLSVLIDRETKLIHKWQGIFDGVTLSVTFAYGAPVLNDIYDLGIPSDAKVIDYRSLEAGNSQQDNGVAAFLDRLDGRVGPNEKLGNYVAVITDSLHGEAGKLTPFMLYLFGRDGDKWFYTHYRRSSLLSEAFKFNGWPSPNPGDVLEQGRNVVPDVFLATDGQEGWFGRYDGKSGSFPRLDKIPFEQVKAHWLAGWSLSGRIWPGRHRIDFQHLPRITIRMEVLRDPKHPGQVGLHVDEQGWERMPGIPFKETEMTYWLDPTRSDVPAEETRKMVKLDGSISEETTKYLEYAQLADGTWYPIRWQKTTSRGVGHDEMTIESQLQIIPDMKPDQSWFTNLAERLHNNNTGTGNDKQP